MAAARAFGTRPVASPALNFVPGLLLGTELAALLFFLNPSLPFEPAPALKAAGIYGGLLGLLSSALLTLVGRRRRAVPYRPFPWALTTVLLLGALLYWTHASRFSYFLPPGINVRMLKAATLLTILGLISFYTALLHTLHRRPYGRRTKTLLTLVVLASVYTLADRREAYKPRVQPTPLPSVIEVAQRPSLLVVGLEGATLDAILPLATQGHLPFLSGVIQSGAYARLESLTPVEPPALWTSIATGKLPYKHGIVGPEVYPASPLVRDGYLQLLPQWIGFRTWGTFHSSKHTSTLFRRAIPLWEIAQRLGVETALVDWPVTSPAPDSLAFALSDRFFAGDYRVPHTWPRDLAERGVLFRTEPEDVDVALLPGAGERVPFTLLEALSADLWRESLGRFLLEERGDVQAVFLRLPGLAQVSEELFGGYSAAQFDGVQKDPQQEAAAQLTAYYRHLDGFLADWWERTPEPRILAVLSAHGYRPPEGLRKLTSRVARQPLRGYASPASDGVLMLLGEGIRAGAFLDGAQQVDVMPTLLYALGFPVARDLDGRVLTGAFESAFLAAHPMAFVPSYETLAAKAPEEFRLRPLQE